MNMTEVRTEYKYPGITLFNVNVFHNQKSCQQTKIVEMFPCSLSGIKVENKSCLFPMPQYQILLFHVTFHWLVDLATNSSAFLFLSEP